MGEVLDLDWDFVDHLGIPFSLRKIQQEEVSPELIETPKAREIYEFQLDHLRKYREWAKPEVLENEFTTLGLELQQPVAVIDDLIERLRTRFVRKQGSRELKNVARVGVNNPERFSSELGRAAKRFTEITSKRGKTLGTGDFNLAVAAYNERVAKGVQGSLGFTELNTHFHGLPPLGFVIAPPKGYKSWWIVQTLLDNIIEFGKLGQLYSLELPPEDTIWRLNCLAANIPYWKYLRGQLKPEEMKNFQEADEHLQSLGVYKVTKPAPEDRTVDYLINSARDKGADFILIDQLQYVVNDKGYSLGEMNDTGEYWKVINKLVDYSDDGPIFVAHQFNRSIRGADEMPDMTQVKGSAAIEEGATLALGLWANKEMRASNLFQVGTLVSRHYNHKAWEVQVDLSRGCNFKVIGEV